MPEPTTAPARWSHRSLWVRLLGALALSGTLIGLLVGIGWLAYEEQRHEREFAQHQRTLVDLAARGLAVPLWNVDSVAAHSVLLGLVGDPAVERIEVRAPGLPDGRLSLAKPGAREATRDLRPMDFDIPYNGTGSAGPTVVGHAHLVMNTTQLQQNLRDTRLFILVLLAVLMLTMSVVAYIWLGRLVRRPLQQLGRWSARLAQGDWHASMPPQRDDELGALATQLTHMGQQMQAAQADLRRSEQRYRSLFENAGEGLFQIDARGRVLDANNALSAMLGLGSAQEALAHSRQPRRLVHLDRQDQRRIARLLARQRSITNLPLPITTLHGRALWVELSLHRVVSAVGERPLYQGMLLDVTERQQAQAALALHRDQLEALVAARTTELNEAKHRAEAANQAKSRFLATMSHEFRTPLNAILGFSQLAQMNEALPPETRRQVGLIVDSGQHLLAMISELLDLAAIEAGRLRLNLAPVQLVSLLELCMDAVRLRAQAKRLEVHLHAPPELPHRVLVDGQRLRQVLLNLLTNAVKFTDQGHVTLQVRPIQQAAGRVHLLFEVIDTGIGITKAQRQQLFEPFTQVTDAPHRRQGGTGLGLTICAQLLQLMNSQLELDSVPDAGSRFHFELDLAIYEPLGGMP